MANFVEITVTIPEANYEQMLDIAEKSGMTVDDLVSGATTLVYKNPTQSIIKRVLRLAHGFKIERVLEQFPKSVKPPQTTEQPKGKK